MGELFFWIGVGIVGNVILGAFCGFFCPNMFAKKR